jgi:hypothetical protein
MSLIKVITAPGRKPKVYVKAKRAGNFLKARQLRKTA